MSPVAKSVPQGFLLVLVKDVSLGIPKSDLLGVTVALIHVAAQRFWQYEVDFNCISLVNRFSLVPYRLVVYMRGPQGLNGPFGSWAPIGSGDMVY